MSEDERSGRGPEIPIIESSPSTGRQRPASQGERKARFRILDTEGKPVPGIQLNVDIELGENEQRTLRMRTGPTGYATLDVTSIEELLRSGSARTVLIEPSTGGDSVEVAPNALLDTGATVVELSASRDSYPTADSEGQSTAQAFMRPPDSADAENAPELFNPAIVEENGNCSIDFTANVDVHESFFNQIVRVNRSPEPGLFDELDELDELDDERIPSYVPGEGWTDLDSSGDDRWRVLDGHMPFELTKDYPPWEWDPDDPFLEQVTEPSFGTMNVYKQSWTLVGHSIGKLLHSLTLAPCESTEVSMIEWSRSERGRREEDTTIREEKSHELHRDRMIEEMAEGVVKETQMGASGTGQLGGGLSGGAAAMTQGGPVSIGTSLAAGGALSGSISKGRRELQASTVNNLEDNVVQQASSMRSTRSTVVTQSQEVEQDEVRTRAVENHNRNHALSVEYFRVLEHYNVTTELADETDILLIPYELPLALWNDPPDFELFDYEDDDEAPREKSDLIAWLDRYAEELREMVPSEHADGFEALYRLLHKPEVYRPPTVTASNWTVELREAWRPGVTILVHTKDPQEPNKSGQTFTLDHDSGTEGSAVATFSSPPVDVGKIDSIEINFAPEQATRTVVKSLGKAVDDVAEEVGPAAEEAADIAAEAGGVLNTVGDLLGGSGSGSGGGGPLRKEIEKARKLNVNRFRVTLNTDPIDALPQSKSYEILNEAGIDKTLTANNPALPFLNINKPQPDILETETRRYEDYTKVEALINHIQANRISYLRRLWLNEDPDRRAIRFQKYKYPVHRDGTTEPVPLLDLVENKPLGVVGNAVAFRLLEQGQLDDGYEEAADDDLSKDRLVSLPTRGVYAETLLSHCNATEIRDVDRIPTARSRCRTEAPEITGISPGSRRSEEQLSPTVPQSTVDLQQPPAAPQPTGLSEALQVLSSPQIFRDMSLGPETVQAANSLAQKALNESGQARKQTLEALQSMLGSFGGGSGGQGGQSAEQSAIDAAQEAVRRRQEAAQQAATQAHRQSDPVRNRDHQQNLNEAHESGAISDEAYEEGSKRLHNADSDSELSGALAGKGATAGSGSPILPCREFTPTARFDDTVIIDITPHELQGETVKNWAQKDVHHFPYPAIGDDDAACRDPEIISEIIFHEPAQPVDSWNPEQMGQPKGIHISIERDGTIYNHNDLVEYLHHAEQAHNAVSIGIEIVNPVWMKNATMSNPPTIPVDWPGQEESQPQGDYVLPTQAQCEAAASLVELLTDPPAAHSSASWAASGPEGLAIPRQWFGLTGDEHFRMGNPRDIPNDRTEPGIWAHGHFGGDSTHTDGYFIALYTLLRHEGRDSGGRLSPSDAYSAAKSVARSDTSPSPTWRQINSSDRFKTPLVNLQQYLGESEG